MKLTVCELFAGVGGFTLGLKKSGWRTVYANQFEPSTKRQHAAECYSKNFPDINFDNTDINKVDYKKIPKHTLLVGGFPCQDYSVATTLKNSKGLIGTKGVLWWSIYSILKNKGKDAPDYLFLENVDRLMVSPAIQRGRDFAVMLSCLNELGYAVEWRVINAGEYGNVIYDLYLKRELISLGEDLVNEAYSSKVEETATNQTRGILLLPSDRYEETRFPCLWKKGTVP